MNYAHFIKLQEYEMAYVLSWGAITVPINMKHLNICYKCNCSAFRTFKHSYEYK